MLHKIDERSVEQRIMGVMESLENLHGRIERSENLLATVRDLLVDYWYTNSSPVNDVIEYPKEIKIVIDIINLVIDDAGFECDVLNEVKKELENIIGKLQ